MHCTKCGKVLVDEAKFCAGCGAPVGPGGGGSGPDEQAVSGTWDTFFQNLGSELLQVSRVSPEHFDFVGEQKIKALLSRITLRYQAMALLDTEAKAIRWWEKLTESSMGLPPRLFGISAETRTQKGIKVEVRKTVKTVGGGYAYHYGDLRTVVENEAARRGWAFQLLVKRPKK